jgi:hypothetical protein
MHWVLAAALVLAGGAVLAVAETVTLKVTQRDGEQVELDLNGEVHMIELDDLADGEQREFDAGERTVQVRRVGDELQVMLDGEEFGSHGAKDMIWVTEHGETHHLPGHAKKVIVMKDPEGGEGEIKTYAVRIETDEDCEGCEDVVNIDVERIDELIESGDAEGMMAHREHNVMIFKGSEGEDGPVVIKKIRAFGDDIARYRCEETGSELILKKEDALSDTYICPATGCVMERVEEPEMVEIRIDHGHHADEGGE